MYAVCTEFISVLVNTVSTLKWHVLYVFGVLSWPYKFSHKKRQFFLKNKSAGEKIKV